MINPAFSPERDLGTLIEEFFRSEFSTDNVLITEAVNRMLAAGGKRLRPKMTLLGAEAMGGTASDHLRLAAFMELIHVATLIHDDVVDRAETRRGVNATAIDYGNRISVLAGDYLFAWIFKNVTGGYPHPIPNILSSTLADICDGEVLQLAAIGDLDLSVAGYVEVAMKKTAMLFAASAECGALAAGASRRRAKAVHDFGLYFGIAFQMNDDLLDMTGNLAALGKPVGGDLRERKMTAPLIFALQDADGDLRSAVETYFSEDESAEETTAAIVRSIDAHGGFAKTRAAIAGYVERAKLSLAPIGATGARGELFALADALSK